MLKKQPITFRVIPVPHRAGRQVLPEPGGLRQPGLLRSDEPAPRRSAHHIPGDSFQFQEIIDEELANGYDELLFLLINSRGSATYGNAVQARDLFFDEHPEQVGKVNISVIDSRGYSALYGYLAVEAAKRAQAGEDLASVEAYVTQALEHRMIYFRHLLPEIRRKSGRIPSAAAFLGDKLGLKPVMKIFDHEITNRRQGPGRSTADYLPGGSGGPGHRPRARPIS